MSNGLSMTFANIDPSAKADIFNITSTPRKSWSMLDDFRYDSIATPGNYATMEHNYAILNGEMEEFPNSTSGKTWGFWSDAFSDSKGNFDSPPALEIFFGANHKSPGLTLYFYPHTDDYASRVRVEWYGGANELIYSGVYSLTSTLGVIRQPVANYRRIKITFLSTNIPFRYLKLYAMDFGVIRTFVDSEVSSLRLLEEIDPTIENISINTINATIRTRDSVFSPITSEDFDDMMMRRQYLTIEKEGVHFGTFFLERWKDPYQSGIVFDIEAWDAMNVLDLYPFDGNIYNNVLVSTILDAIFAVAFPTKLIKYTLDPAFANSRVTGWIPQGPCGTAFHHIMFAIHAIADTSRRNDIWIYPSDTDITYEIPLVEQYRRGSDEPTDYFSGVDVVSYSYSPGTETTDIFDDILSVGKHRLDFSEPLHTFTISGATLFTTHVNYVVVNVSVAGRVTLKGTRYIVNTLAHSVRAEIAAGEVESIKRFEGFTLVNPNIGLELANKEFQWLKNPIRLESQIKLGDREVGYIAKMQTRGRPLLGTISRLDINLRAGTADMEVVGNVLD